MKKFSSYFFIVRSYIRLIVSLFLIIFFCISLSTQVALAETSSPARQLASLFANQQNFTADFSQQSFNSADVLVDSSSGHIVLSRPFHLRWETKVPFAQTIIINGDRYLQYDSDIDQLIISSIGSQDTAIPSLLLSADGYAIESFFTISRVALNPVVDRDHHSGIDNVNVDNINSTDELPSLLDQSYVLSPLDKSSLIAELRINFQQQLITSIVILDDFGSRSQFDFNNITASKVIDDALFELDPPADTDIIYR